MGVTPCRKHKPLGLAEAGGMHPGHASGACIRGIAQGMSTNARQVFQSFHCTTYVICLQASTADTTLGMCLGIPLGTHVPSGQVGPAGRPSGSSTRAIGSHTRASGSPTRPSGSHTRASGSHTRASVNHTRPGVNHTRASGSTEMFASVGNF